MAVVVDVDHETGDLSQWDITQTDGGDLAATNAAALAGTTWGAEFTIDDTNHLYGQENITSPAGGDLRARFYFDINLLTMADGDQFQVFSIRTNGDIAFHAAYVDIRRSGSNYQVNVFLTDDTPASFGVGWTTFAKASEHCLEFLLEQATDAVSGDGALEAWLDGVSMGTVTDKDNYDIFDDINAVRLEARFLDAGTSGTFYGDEVIVRDDATAIGCPSLTTTTTTVAPAATTLPPIGVCEIGAGYQVWIDDPEGTRLALCSQFEVLEYTHVVNGIGTCVLTVGREFDHTLFREDGLIEVWRRPPGGVFKLEDVFFTRLIERGMDANDRIYTKVTGYDGNDLLKRRIIGYAAGTAYAEKAATNADDQMKALVRENLGSLATVTDRDIETPLNFSIQADLSLGPNVAVSAPWRNLFDVIKEIADATLTLADPIFFDVPAVQPNAFEFRTYHNQRGTDHSWPDGAAPIILAAEFGNLRTPRVLTDYRSEINHVYCGGKGEGADRTIVQWQDVGRVNASVWNRREGFQDARNCPATGTTCLDWKAQDFLNRNMPTTTFFGELVDSPGARYQVHWNFGDKLTAVFDGDSYDVYVDVVQVSKRGDGAENIVARLETRNEIESTEAPTTTTTTTTTTVAP